MKENVEPRSLQWFRRHFVRRHFGSSHESTEKTYWSAQAQPQLGEQFCGGCGVRNLSCTPTHLYMYICIYVYMCVCIYPSILTSEKLNWASIPTQLRAGCRMLGVLRLVDYSPPPKKCTLFEQFCRCIYVYVCICIFVYIHMCICVLTCMHASVL